MQVQYINIIIISSTDFLFSLIIYFFGVGAGKQIIYSNFIQLEGEAAWWLFMKKMLSELCSLRECLWRLQNRFGLGWAKMFAFNLLSFRKNDTHILLRMNQQLILAFVWLTLLLVCNFWHLLDLIFLIFVKNKYRMR